jgi:glycosyltransferase involved in cell wall biosynthesis
MKILYLCLDRGVPVLGTKGAAVHVRAMVSALVREGHEVTLVAPRLTRGGEQAAFLDAVVRHLPPDDAVREAVARLHALDDHLGARTGVVNEVRRLLYDGVVVEALMPELEADPPDAIYERLSLLGTSGARLARHLGVPHLVEMNAPLALEAGAYRRLQLTELAERVEVDVIAGASAVLAVSQAVADHAVEIGADRARVHVLPNAIDPELFAPRAPDPAARAALGAGPDDVLLAFVGGLRPWHGVEALPELLERLVDDGRRVRLVIAGDGPLREPLERAFAARGLDRRVRLTGAIPHDAVAMLVSQIDVAVAPYPRLDHEFYFSPLKLFEYMGAGAAVVAARVGQVGEVVEDGVTGLLYPAGDAEALASRCARLVDDQGLRRALGAAAAQRIHEGFTWDHNARRVGALASMAEVRA